MKAKVFKIHPDAIIPSRKSAEAAGYDIHCLEGFSIYPGQKVAVKTGLVIQPEPGYHMEILARSGLAYKHGIMLTNNVGLIDRDYAGPEDEIAVMLYRVHPPLDNIRRPEPVLFSPGDRIAQLVFRKTELLELEEVVEAPGINRGGLGSTGVKQ